MSTIPARAQFCDSSTGLLQMQTAEMQDDGTFMITTNFLKRFFVNCRLDEYYLGYCWTP